MKSLVKFIDDISINESIEFDDNLVTLVTYKDAPGIMFGTEDNEMPQDAVKEFSKELGFEYDDIDYKNIVNPVFFWNLNNPNQAKWVPKAHCKPLL